MITKKIKELTEEKNWKFEFSAANQDSWKVGSSMGITNTQDFQATPEGMRDALYVSRNTSLNMRMLSAQRLGQMTPAARRAQSQPTPGSNNEPEHYNPLPLPFPLGPPPRLTRQRNNFVYDGDETMPVELTPPPGFPSRSQSMQPQ